MKKVYAGVGSRETPIDIQAIMRDMAFDLANENMVLRSGAAIGADSAFESGCDAAGGKKEIFVAPDMYGMDVRPDYIAAPRCENYIECLKMARSVHPNWHAMQSWGRAQHARNVMQVLGEDLKTPANFLICWAPVENGSLKGGTRTAWEIAKLHKVPCFNLAVMDVTHVRESIKRIMTTNI